MNKLDTILPSELIRVTAEDVLFYKNKLLGRVPRLFRTICRLRGWTGEMDAVLRADVGQGEGILFCTDCQERIAVYDDRILVGSKPVVMRGKTLKAFAEWVEEAEWHLNHEPLAAPTAFEAEATAVIHRLEDLLQKANQGHPSERYCRAVEAEILTHRIRLAEHLGDSEAKEELKEELCDILDQLEEAEHEAG